MVIMETSQSWVFLLTLLAVTGYVAKVLGDFMIRMEDAPVHEAVQPRTESPVDPEFVQLLRTGSQDEPFDQYADATP